MDNYSQCATVARYSYKVVTKIVKKQTKQNKKKTEGEETKSSSTLLTWINLQNGVREQPIIAEWTSGDLQLDPEITEYKYD